MDKQSTSSKSKGQETPRWLLRVQEQSWEPEILISGIVLFGLFQVPGLIEQLHHFLNHYSLEIFSAGTADSSMVALLKVANVWLIGGFMFHLLLRSIWVAFIGLSYVYTDGVQIERLKFSEQYNRTIFSSRGYQDNILRLEKVCSTTFAISFLLFMCILGAFFFLGIVALFLAIITELFPSIDNFTWVDHVLMGIGVLYILDFLTLGALKRIPYFSKLYYPVYRVMSVLSLSPLYRKIYYGLVSNNKPWKVVVAVIVFIGISCLLAFSFRWEENIADTIELRLSDGADQVLYAGHYENIAEGKPSATIMIPADIIERNVLRVFIVHRSAYEERYIKSLCDFEARRDSVQRDTLAMDCLSRFYSLELDGQAVKTEFLFLEKPATRQLGLQTYLDIAHLEKGMHELELFYHFPRDDGTENLWKAAKVEFYKALPVDTMSYRSSATSLNTE